MNPLTPSSGSDDGVAARVPELPADMGPEEMKVALEGARKLLAHWCNHQLHSDEAYRDTRAWLITYYGRDRA